jgi:hypothetical protein
MPVWTMATLRLPLSLAMPLRSPPPILSLPSVLPPLLLQMHCWLRIQTVLLLLVVRHC